MTDVEQSRVKLQVAGAKDRDVGKSVARMRKNAFQALGIKEGDVIEIVGKRRSPDMDKQLFPEDIFRSIFEQRTYGLQETQLVVVSTSPRGTVQITDETTIEL